jgi:hypothetical protein
MAPVTVPFTKAMPEGLMVPSLVMLPEKMVFSTQTLATTCPLGLSNGAVMGLLHGAAKADGAPPPINNAATELEANNARITGENEDDLAAMKISDIGQDARRV